MSQQVQSARATRSAMCYIAAGTLLWAALESVGVLLASAHHPLQVVWVRYATHLALLLAIFGPRQGTELVRVTRPRIHALRGLLMLLMPLCFLAAMAIGKPANVFGVFWVAPLLTMALSAWLLRERVALWQCLATLGGWGGVLLIVRPGSGAIGLVMLPALGMALCLSLYLVLSRLLRDESRLTNLVATAACVLVPLSAVMPGLWRMPSSRTLLLMAAIGLLGLGALYTYDRATELAPVSVVAPFLLAQPVWALALTIVFDGAHPGRAALLGAALVGAACALLFASVGWRPMRTAPGATRFPSVPGSTPLPPGLSVPQEPVNARHEGAHS